jgi:hypothetical protein
MGITSNIKSAFTRDLSHHNTKFGFQRVVIIIAIIILIITLCILGYYLRKEKLEGNYPPVIPECPDYWRQEVLEKINNDNEKETRYICTNNKSLGKNSDNSIDFNDKKWNGKYKGARGLCEKKKWANKHELSWDGLSNNDDVCKLYMN